jgi:hypothetical protein
MHLFDKEDASQNQRAFYITIILAAFLTYIISGSILWKVSPEEQRVQFLTRLRDKFATLPRLIQRKVPADEETSGQ